MLDNNKYLQLSLILISSVFPVSLYAQSAYLFPSDISDQSEQMQHDSERAQRYESQRQWVYPDEQKIRQQEQTSGQNQYDYSESSEYPRSDHYKYDNFSNKGRSNISSDINRSEPRRIPRQYDEYGSAQQQSYSEPAYSSPSPRYHYQSAPRKSPAREQQKQGRSPENSARYQSSDTRGQAYQPEPAYETAQPYQAKRNDQQQHRYYQEQPRELYVSDLINKPEGQAKRFFPDNSNIRRYSERVKEQAKHTEKLMRQQRDQAETQIRYIPVPVYTYAMPPGTLPGTVPGVVTPPNMVPGYSHLSPSYNNNYGLSPFSATPWSGLGSYPMVNPYELFYKSYSGNNGSLIPYNPASIVPGLGGFPDVFSK